MSRLEILKASLAKKEAIVDAKIGNHFETVASANGQPLNDKRNGASTMRQWERQNDSIRAAVAGVELTKAAIEREENKIASCEVANEKIPQPILDLVTAGVLTQWRKHPETFFVVGVEKARIVWIEKKGLCNRYYNECTDKDQRAKFAQVFNELKTKINA